MVSKKRRGLLTSLKLSKNVERPFLILGEFIFIFCDLSSLETSAYDLVCKLSFGEFIDWFTAGLKLT